MTTPTTCEATEEQRARANALIFQMSPWARLTSEELAEHIAQALAQESSREHERAEGLAREVAALQAGAAQRTLLKGADDAAYVQLRTRSLEAEARAEGLAKELEAEHLQGEECTLSWCEKLDAATAQVAELEKQLSDEHLKGESCTLEWNAKIEALEKQLATRPRPRANGWTFRDWRPRFWSTVNKTSDGECWRWTGSHDALGYGRIKIDGARVRAHRVSWEIATGNAWPDNKIACHSCDHPWCVNPAHIRPGTHQDNSDDAVSRGRRGKPKVNATRIPKTHCHAGHPFNEANTRLRRDTGGRECIACCKSRDVKRYLK